MTTNEPFLQDAVSDTLIIPLAMRTLEAAHPSPIMVDPMAADIVEQLGCDLERFKGKRASQVGTAIRVRHFDEQVYNFITRHDDPVVISLGCGLDTRFQRIDTGKGTFYEIDLPEVIELRESLIPSAERNPYMAISMFDPGWMEAIRQRHPNTPVCIVAEGVFMYFDEAPIHALFCSMANAFQAGEIIFDACSSTACRNTKRHETVKDTNAMFKWGLDNDKELESWSPRLRHKDTTLYMNQETKRWGMLGLVGRLVPRIGKAFRMLRYEIIPA
ncbi:MAG: class I SAM-dependent methyltransferase [Desulfovibrio sp.]|uniref:class I SAM-dependent methyltransferase n=1 Tax=Desulfovibrio sp. 7SRBS1 TaxID=3378064 RepID=UPI003B40F234